jgi:hypothetical protein
MREAVERLWPELDWIVDEGLRESVLQTWILAFEQSPLEPDDLNEIPFTLKVPDWIDMDVVIAGAILADVGKLLEYEKVDGQLGQSHRGQALRHPFTGVHLAMACGVPDDVCHLIATHAAEGDLVTRTTEAFIVHHADFMSFDPFKNL